jgi:translation elongation factor EF-Ts
MSDLHRLSHTEVKALREKTGMRMSEAKLVALANRQTAMLDEADSLLEFYGNTRLEEVAKLQNEVIRSFVHVYDPK